MEDAIPIKGMKDLIGQECELFTYICKKSKQVAELCHFEEILLPIAEYSHIFKRTLGNQSDVVQKEMYEFEDKNGKSITLRPEFTASIARSIISNKLDHYLPLRLFTHGPLFRYERPQKGRQRQFHQINFEIIGENTPFVDAEVITTAILIIQNLGISEQLTLEINSLGTREDMIKYQDKLANYFSKYEKDLSEQSKERLKKNPLRILDSKEENDKKLLEDIPLIKDYISEESSNYFNKVMEKLESLKSQINIPYKINNKLVRGLDYYEHTVFEFVMNSSNSQNTVLAGGRYDNLIGTMSRGKSNVPGIGFASGIERLMNLMTHNINEKKETIAIISDNETSQSTNISQEILFLIRKAGYRAYADISGSNIGKKLSKANKKNSKIAIIIGKKEIESKSFILKNLETAEQKEMHSHEQIMNYLTHTSNSNKL